MDEEPPRYESAFQELVTIVNDLQEGNTSVDELAARVKRAADLVALCTGLLKATEDEVTAIVKRLEGGEPQL